MKSNLDLVAKYNPVLLVANSILDRSFKDGQTMTHMKLQKLTYFVYKKYLEDTGNTLFDEDFEAWKYGPALRSVYEVFRAFAHIDGYYAIFDGEKNPKIVSLKHENFYDALDFVMKRYGNYSGLELSEITHGDGTAWKKAVDNDVLELDTDDILNEEWVF